MKKWIAIAIVILVAGGAFALVVRMRANGGPGPNGTADAYRYAVVTRGSISEKVSCSGYVESNLDVEIKCKASGTISELPFDISDPVEKGALLLQLDPVDENRNVQQAEVALAGTEAKLAKARQDLVVAEMDIKNSRADARATLESALASAKDLRAKAKRMAALREKDYASAEDVDSAEATAVMAESDAQKARVGLVKISADEARLELLRQEIKLAESDMEQAGITLDQARQRLSETHVYAPISGVISSRLVQIGQIIASSTSNVSGGTSLMELSDLSRIFVTASVDESDVGQVRPGQTGTVTVDAFPDEQFRGEVVRVATRGENVSNVVTFDVKIEILDESKSKLRPEMTADVEILVAEKMDALLVPAEAVRGNGPQKTVLTPASAPGGDPEPVVVVTGLSDDTNTEIVSGLEANADIVIAPDTGSSSWQRGTDSGGPPPMMGFGGPPR